MTRSNLTSAAMTALTALLALAACGKPSPSATAQPADPLAENMAQPAAPIEMPPAVKSTKSYRCTDNSVIVVDLFAGDKQASLREGKDGPSTMLRAANAGEPLTAEGFELVTKGTNLTVTRPAHPKQVCRGS